MERNKIFGIIVLIILVVLGAYYLNKNIHEFKDLKLENWRYIFLIVPIFIFGYWLIGVVLDVLLRPFGIELNLKESFMISIVTGFYNLITPFRGGMVARGMYLKRRHNFAYTDFLATLAASYVIVFLISSFIGLLSVYLIFMFYGTFNWIIFLIFFGMFIGMLFIVIVAPRFSERKNNWINRFIRVINGWHLIKNNKKVIFYVGILSVIQILLGALMVYLQFKVFGLDVGYLKSLFLTCIGSLGILIAITPANLGVAEAITVFSALTLGIGAAESLGVALLGRAISIIVLFILGPWFSWKLMRKN